MVLMKFCCGCLPDSVDVEDPIYCPDVRIFMPSRIDITPDFPAYAQGRIGSCTASVLAAAVRFVRKKHYQSPDFSPSRLFIQYNARLLNKKVEYDAVVSFRAGLNSLKQYGVCPENLWPYDDTPPDENKKFPPHSRAGQSPFKGCYSSAKRFKVTQCYRLNPQLDHLKNVLARGFPFVFGFNIYNSWIMQNPLPKKVSFPSVEEKKLASHGALCIGYDDETGLFKIRNSWGSDVGEDGNFYLPYKYMLNKKLVSDFWVITGVKN
ncbi:MAG: C1 family peptidase [Candidatus Arsenophonus phytopathogenicus]